MSRVLRRTPLAWNITLDEDPAEASSTRFLDFAAFFAFGFPAVVTPAIGLPVNEVLPLALCAIAFGREATSRARVPGWFVGGLLLLLTALTVTSYLHGLTPAKRLLHVALYLTLATFIASGRIHIPSAARGVAVGIATSIVLSMAGFGPDNYVGRLTGYLGDPNGGGYIITVLGAVALGLGPKGRYRYLLIPLLAGAVVLTYSRTTLLAVALSVLWLLVGRRMGSAAGVLLVALLVYLVGHIPEQLRLFGPFSDRSGSDALRVRIVAQEHLDISHAPFLGSGAGTAHVNVQGDEFFYHSSYLALQREGGILCVVILVTIVALVFLASIRMPQKHRNGWLEAGLISLMVCAVNLGEALLELPAAVVMGMCLYRVLNLPEPTPPDPVEGMLTNAPRRRPRPGPQPDPS